MKGAIPLPSSRKAAIFLWLVPVLFLVVSAIPSSRILHERALVAQTGERGVRSGGLILEISKRPAFAFGFRNFLGDLAWLQAVQAAGSRRMSRGDYDRLAVLIRIVGNLDPRFVVPYLLGGLLLGDSPDHVGDALDILEKGRNNHPADWRFPFYTGYIRYFSLGDPLEGGKALMVASRIAGSPPYLTFLSTRMLSEGKKPETALAFLRGMVREETDPARLEILRKRMREVIVERDIQFLERAVDAYRQNTGEAPATLTDLLRSGLIPRIPVEPHGGRYLLQPDGTVRSDRVTDRLKVFKSSGTGEKR